MSCENEIFRIDTIMVDGDTIRFEDGTGTIEGAAGFETEAVLAATGDDATMRKRVARILKCKILFVDATTPEQFSKVCDAQIVMTNTHTGKRVRAGKCRFKSLGEIGGGSVELEFNVLSALQWL